MRLQAVKTLLPAGCYDLMTAYWPSIVSTGHKHDACSVQCTFEGNQQNNKSMGTVLSLTRWDPDQYRDDPTYRALCYDGWHPDIGSL